MRDEVQKLQDKCDATIAEKNQLIESMETTRLRLERAPKLTEGLAGERIRWKETRDCI